MKNEKLTLLDEPLLEFANNQTSESPHDGLSLFGSYSIALSGVASHVSIGTKKGLNLWLKWCSRMNQPASCKDVSRQRAWPPFPGYDVAFNTPWPNPLKEYQIDPEKLDLESRKSDRYERASGVVSCYLETFKKLKKLDATPSLVVCIVPDHVYENCRTESYVSNKSDTGYSKTEKAEIRAALKDKRSGQTRFQFDGDGDYFDLETFEYSPDFRRHLKAKVMKYDLPVQIIRESTLSYTKKQEDGEPGDNPLSDRLWNLSTGLSYKCGFKPWKLASARDGVCYVGLAFRQSDNDHRDACCAAQLFLDNGDGIVFVGEFGPWYSPKDKQFQLTSIAAKNLLEGTIKTYSELDGRPLKEVVLHSHSSISKNEYAGYKKAVPEECNLIAVRVRREKKGPRLFRNGNRPPLRGLFWQRSNNYGLLYTTGFVPRVGTYEGFETPVPLSLSIQHGDANIQQIANDILGLTKLNYNACGFGESEPITIKYSKRIGEILLANQGLPKKDRKHTFRFYI